MEDFSVDSRGTEAHITPLVQLNELEFGQRVPDWTNRYTVFQGRFQKTDVVIKMCERSAGRSTSGCMESSGEIEHLNIDRLERIGEECLRREAHTLSQMRHPNVVSMMGFCQQPVCLVMERCARGSLASLLLKVGQEEQRRLQLPWPCRLQMALDVAQGMRCVHEHPKCIVHGSLCSSSVQVCEAWRCKVADFGLAHMEGLPSPSVATSQACSATIPAPELMRGESSTTASDVFSFSMILFELLFIKPAWLQLTQAEAGGKGKGWRPSIPAITVDLVGGPGTGVGDYVRLMKQCWADPPEARPSFSTIFQTLQSLLQRVVQLPFFLQPPASGFPQSEDRGEEFQAARQPQQNNSSLYSSGPPRLQRQRTFSSEKEQWHIWFERRTISDSFVQSAWSCMTQTETHHRVDDACEGQPWPIGEAGRVLWKDAGMASVPTGPGCLRRVASECFKPVVAVPLAPACTSEADAEAAGCLLGPQVLSERGAAGLPPRVQQSTMWISATRCTQDSWTSHVEPCSPLVRKASMESCGGSPLASSKVGNRLPCLVVAYPSQAPAILEESSTKIYPIGEI